MFYAWLQGLWRAPTKPSGDGAGSSAVADPAFGPIVWVALVLLPLVSLALVPIVVERQVAALRREVLTVSDPARAHLREMQLAIAMETAATRAYLLTGDAGYAVRHQAARATRMRHLAALSALMPRASRPVQPLFRQIASQLGPADAVLDSLYAGRLSRAEFLHRLPAQQARFEGVNAIILRLGNALRREGSDPLAEIQRTQRWAIVLSIFLVGLALLAAFLVLRLGVAYRALALSERAARAEAERQRAESESIAESRSRLVRGFTHDVKNPLGAAAGYLALVEEGALDPAEGMKRARRTVSHALVLVDELLQLAGTEAGEIAIRREPIDLLQIARDAAEDCRRQAQAGGLLLQVESRHALPPIASDARRVRQILGNLISNAVKYTPSGGVTVRVGMSDVAREGRLERWAAVEVADTGPGLSAVDLELLFHEFRRLGSSIGTGGHGLGLAISKRLAEALGGDVVVHSAPGVGSTFALLLPLEGSHELPPEALPPVESPEAP